MMGGKVSPRDTYDMDNRIGGGVDPRTIDRVIYTYDGTGKITEHTRDGMVNTYRGKKADPTFLVMHIRRSLGTRVATEIAGKPIPFDQM